MIRVHVSMKPALALLAVLTLPVLGNDFRPWRNAEGDKSIQGRFVKRDAFSLTILREDRRQLTLPLEKIHPDDVAWLNQNHPLPQPKPAEPAGVIENLRFGDTRNEVMAKLSKSKMFETKVAAAHMARTGLNGVFRTKKTIGGYHCVLSFNWHEEGGLKAITLQTDPEDISAWDSKLKPCFNEMVNLVSALHGKALVDNKKVDLQQLENDAMFANYFWHLEPQGSVLLGPAKQDGKVMVAVRFTEESMQPK